jgi:hypothetical protein
LGDFFSARRCNSKLPATGCKRAGVQVALVTPADDAVRQLERFSRARPQAEGQNPDPERSVVTAASVPLGSRLCQPRSCPKQDNEQLLANQPILSNDIKLQFSYTYTSSLKNQASRRGATNTPTKPPASARTAWPRPPPSRQRPPFS